MLALFSRTLFSQRKAGKPSPEREVPKVCFEREADCALVECGHANVCQDAPDAARREVGVAWCVRAAVWTRCGVVWWDMVGHGARGMWHGAWGLGRGPETSRAPRDREGRPEPRPFPAGPRPVRGSSSPAPCAGGGSPGAQSSAPAEILDFRGLDSSGILSWRGRNSHVRGEVPEVEILVGIILQTYSETVRRNDFA